MATGLHFGPPVTAWPPLIGGRGTRLIRFFIGYSLNIIVIIGHKSILKTMNEGSFSASTCKFQIEFCLSHSLGSTTRHCYHSLIEKY